MLILFKPFLTRDVVNLWRGSNPDHNANKTVADVTSALKQFKQINQQPQNTASTRARYVMLTYSFIQHDFSQKSSLATVATGQSV